MTEERSPELAAGSPLQKYLDRALGILEKFHITEQDAAPSALTGLLEEVRHIDEAPGSFNFFGTAGGH